MSHMEADFALWLFHQSLTKTPAGQSLPDHPGVLSRREVRPDAPSKDLWGPLFSRIRKTGNAVLLGRTTALRSALFLTPSRARLRTGEARR